MLAFAPPMGSSPWLPIESLDYPTACDLLGVQPGADVTLRLRGWWREASVSFAAGSVIGLRAALSMARANRCLRFRPTHWKPEATPDPKALRVGFKP